ncbi:MAG TPA: histidine kinase, partial [Thermoanaerobaculia bacterium]|nr:histidine kinase [Thermoanaerobaculia bacterium]
MRTGKRRWRRHDLARLASSAFLIVAIWMLVALFSGWQHHSMLLARGKTDILAERLAAMAATFMAWAVTTPIVMYLTDLFPVRWPIRARNGAITAAVVFGLAALHTLVGAWLPVVLEGVPMVEVDYRASMLALFHNYALIAALLAGAATFLRVKREDATRRRAEFRLQAELAEARLRQLRADLRPHFLFNTLNGVAALLHRDPPGAEQMLYRLRDLLRASMASESARETELDNELEFVARYLEIQKMRFGPKLTAVIR